MLGHCCCPQAFSSCREQGQLSPVMPSNHLILCHPLLLLPSIFLDKIPGSNPVPCIGRQTPSHWTTAKSSNSCWFCFFEVSPNRPLPVPFHSSSLVPAHHLSSRWLQWPPPWPPRFYLMLSWEPSSTLATIKQRWITSSPSSKPCTDTCLPPRGRWAVPLVLQVFPDQAPALASALPSTCTLTHLFAFPWIPCASCLLFMPPASFSTPNFSPSSLACCRGVTPLVIRPALQRGKLQCTHAACRHFDMIMIPLFSEIFGNGLSSPRLSHQMWELPLKPKIWTNAINQMHCLGKVNQRTQRFRVDQRAIRRRQWHPTLVFLPGKSHDGGAW